ncbi:uncharacterized protein LY89DRAFT_597749 [Mollisia scopiformis]|uniref:Uncharacterized protein n=1 Tax=Mollisia scopiformis TaxID=149040 RepID=A0A132BCQ6_MOLSC|nr:uncharacterized protein LY89DRAFT_597749 [Mollisia scopiformis]KUJ09779.1 hypothetical protein LY89DRAFT_597749 [Mollisia scopiformis]
MLRRDSHRLDRRKSTSSVHSTSESINLETARHHAHTAAMLAFLRAQQRSSADSSHNGDAHSRSNNSNHVSSNRQSLPPQTTTQDGNRVVRRQQSVRFVGPNGLERRESLTRATQTTIQPQLSSATLRPMAMTTNAPVPAAYRPPSRSSSIGKASSHKVAEGLMAANAFKEYYTQEDDVASTPSSYRRLRRSKSMFSPLKAPSIFYTNGSPKRLESISNAGHMRSYSHTPTSQPTHPALRAPKSMVVLNNRGHSGTDEKGRDREEIQQARDRFFHEKHRQRLREQPSFLFRSKAQRQQPFRKSVRSSSTNSYGMPTDLLSPAGQTKSSGLKAAARKASKNIKNKLRRVFGRSKDEPVIIPHQQVEARETHVRHYNGDLTPGQEQFEGFSNIPHPDESALSRVASRVPSIHTATSNQQLRSHAGSVKSFKSDLSDDKSRVTVLNTGANAPRPIERERDHQRLSIINEVGTHHPSSSYYRKHKHTNQISPYPRIEDSRIPQPSPDIRMARSTSGTPATIRQVPASTGSDRSSSNQWSVPESTIQSRTSSDDVFSPAGQSGGPKLSLRRSYYENTESYLSLPTPQGMSPQKMADRNERLMPETKVIREARTTFFGGSTYTISRKTSPFRRAMAEVSQNSNDLQSSGQSEKAYSESVYSRTTSGQTPAAANSSTSLPMLTTNVPMMVPTAPGDVVIIDQTVYRPSGPHNVGHSVTSSGSSQEWKKWMSSEVGKFERTKENNVTPTYINYTLPTMPRTYNTGHVRENAQINDDDSPIVYQPLGSISQPSPNIQILPLKPILKKPIPAAPPLPPPIPPRSPLRKKLSKASLKSQNSSDNGRARSAPNSAASKKLHKRRLSGGPGDIQNSQKLVENFLNSRRKRIASESDDVAGAFL